ncbi:MAG: anhydro-N-acetylmuramic acid kinase [Oleispira sp.]|nr:anhydro-N-acetylmuramic acid kinase [Oleispira sp.]
MLYIGLMSGTSLDGIDAALVEINQDGQLQILGNHYQPYQPALQKTLFELSQASDINLEQLLTLDQTLGRLYGEACLTLLEKFEYSASDIQAIGCHGQTIRHKPRPDAFSLQIGDPNFVAELTGITTIADFRRRDIAAGGEGAPLVPAFHQDVFLDFHNPRQILNLGGIANITVLSQNPDDTFGFDLGPANALSNEWVEKHWQISYDKGGIIARSGTIQQSLLDNWLTIDYFDKAPPKSTGRELFNLAQLEKLTPEINNLKKEDVLATLIELTAVSISLGIERWGYTDGELFLCGGGAHNIYLVERIQHHLLTLRIGRTDDLGIPVDMVEACAFAWLASRTIRGLTGNLANTTGAKGARILGAIYPA